MLLSWYIALPTTIAYHRRARSVARLRRGAEGGSPAGRLLAWFEADYVAFASAGAAAGSGAAADRDSICDVRGGGDVVRSRDMADAAALRKLTAAAAALPTWERRRHILVAFLASGAFLGLAVGAMARINALANVRRPIDRPFLRDVGFTVLGVVAANHTDASSAGPELLPNVLLWSLIITSCLYSFASEIRFIITRRVMVIYGMIQLLRCLTVPMTYPPDPSPGCVVREHEPGKTCGDLVFSDHTVSFVLFARILTRYSQVVHPRWHAAITVVSFVWAVVGMVSIVWARLHYTQDVLVAVFVTFAVWNPLMAVVESPCTVRAWRLLEWFERDTYLLRAGPYLPPLQAEALPAGAVDAAVAVRRTRLSHAGVARCPSLEQPILSAPDAQQFPGEAPGFQKISSRYESGSVLAGGVFDSDQIYCPLARSHSAGSFLTAHSPPSASALRTSCSPSAYYADLPRADSEIPSPPVAE